MRDEGLGGGTGSGVRKMGSERERECRERKRDGRQTDRKTESGWGRQRAHSHCGAERATAGWRDVGATESAAGLVRD